MEFPILILPKERIKQFFKAEWDAEVECGSKLLIQGTIIYPNRPAKPDENPPRSFDDFESWFKACLQHTGLKQLLFSISNNWFWRPSFWKSRGIDLSDIREKELPSWANGGYSKTAYDELGDF